MSYARPARPRSRPHRVVASTTLAALITSMALAGCADARPSDDGSQQEDVLLEPYDPNTPAGSAPDLPARFGVPGNYDADIAVQMSSAIKEAMAAEDIEYTSALANGDLAQFRTQAESMFAQGLGGWWRFPPYTAEDLEQAALDQGIYAVSATGGNTHTQLVANNAALGRSAAEAAVDWADETLDGTANVVILNGGLEDPGARAWYEAALATLKEHDGITIVADQQTGYTSEEGADVMATILQAHPDVNIVLGFSSVISGVLATFEAMGRGNDPSVYLTSVNTGPDLLAKVEKGDTIMRSAWADPWPIYGYAIGVFARKWLDGESVPRLVAPPDTGYLNINSPELAREWSADMADPKGTWENKRDMYLALYGNISYDTRDNYWREPVIDPTEVIAAP